MIAVLLAGGRSERVGTDKPTLELNGEMLVERHLRQREINSGNAWGEIDCIAWRGKNDRSPQGT